MIEDLVTRLYEVKREESAIKERRMALEEELARAVGMPEDFEGSQTRQVGRYKVKLTRRMNVKVDPVKLTELARVNNILPVMERCFRKKWELNRLEWIRADEKARLILAPAMETTPGKATFNFIETKEEI